MNETLLKKILEKAIWAPSGDNCQPWFFKWTGQELQIYHDSVRAAHPFNPHGVASILALGCLLEAIQIAASEFNFEVCYGLEDFQLNGRNQWATIQFLCAEKQVDPLSADLLNRRTDRRPYHGGRLSIEMLDRSQLGSAQVHVLSDPPSELTDFIVEAEQLLWSLPDFLPETLQWVRFTLSDARCTGDGLSWRNMGVKVWELPLMPLIRNFPWSVQLLRPFAGPQHRFRVRKQLQTSAGLICFSSQTQSKPDLVTVGQLAMRTWLSLTKMQYGVHPLTLSSAIGMCSNQGLTVLPEKWRLLFQQGDRILRRCFRISDGSIPVWMFRTGASEPLPERAKTFRRPLSDVLL